MMAEAGLRKNSRLVAQNHSDTAEAETPTKNPTIQKFSQRLLLSLFASMKHMILLSRDVTQDYVQSDRALEPPVYIWPPAEMFLSTDVFLRVVRPFYGIQEIGRLW